MSLGNSCFFAFVATCLEGTGPERRSWLRAALDRLSVLDIGNCWRRWLSCIGKWTKRFKL